jgi:rhomboid family protein
MFSHESALHLFFNTFALHSIAPVVNTILGDGWFWSAYIAGGLMSGLTSSAVFKTAMRLRPTFLPVSLGASGAIFTMFAFRTMIFPNDEFYIMFIPYPLKASSLLTGLMTFDFCGAVYTVFRSASRLDHGGHLGGAMFGLFLYYMLKDTHPKVKYVVNRFQKLRERQRAQRQARAKAKPLQPAREWPDWPERG